MACSLQGQCLQRQRLRRSTAQWRRLLALAAGAALVSCVGQRAREGDDAPVVLLPRDAEQLDPRLTGDAYGHKISRLLFASLVTIDPSTLEPVPDLAQRVEIESPVHYRVHLRPGLRFSDGSVLDAHDVAATFESVVSPQLSSRYASTYRRIARIEVSDPLTVVFTLDGPHATFLTDLELPIVRAEDRGAPLAQQGGQPPVSSGPYVLAAREPGRLRLQANPHYHRGLVAHPALELLVVRDDNTRALRLLAGAGDVAINAVPPLLLPLFERDARFAIATAKGVGTTYVGLNLQAPALRDPRVRRALALALDRGALISAKLGGRAQLARSFVPSGHWAASSIDDSPYDPEAARALLDAAGLRPDADGLRLRLSLRCGSDRARVSIARAMVAMWRAVGVVVEVRPSETATLLSDLNRGRFELTFLQVPEVVEPHVLSWFFGSSRIPDDGGQGANRWRLRSVELDAALEAGRLSVDRGERRAAYERVHRILHDELPVIALWHEDVVVVAQRAAVPISVSRLGRFDTLVGSRPGGL